MGVSFAKNKLSPDERQNTNKVATHELYTDYEIPVEDDLLEAIASDYMKRETLRSADISPHLLSHNSSFIANSGSSKDLFIYGGGATGRSNYGVDLHSDEPAVDMPLSLPTTLRGTMANRISAAKVEDSQDNIVPEADDGYYNFVEKAIYEKPKPEAESPEINFNWQKGCLLGSGGFGKVFLGLNEETGEMIAVKEVLLVGDPQQQKRELENFNREVAVMKNLKHENIVIYKGTRVIEDNLHIFMEYVPGGSIASLLGKFGRFSETLIRKYTRQILLGLEYLHSHHIMHRDIKGANILVSHQGVIKLADFGASRRLEGLITANGGYRSLKGTPYWMAPEVVKQCGHGRQADIWSVGCTVIEMATGKPPWHEFTDQVSVLWHIASSTDLPSIPIHLSLEAQDFLKLCFMRDPLERPNASRLLEHPFISSPRKNSSNSNLANPTSSSNAPNEDVFGSEYTNTQAGFLDYRQTEASKPRAMPELPYENAIEEPTWTWDGEKRNMNFVDSKMKTLRGKAVDNSDRLFLDRRLKRSSTQEATPSPPTASALALRRHSTFEAPSTRDMTTVAALVGMKSSAPAFTESGTPMFTRVTDQKLGSAVTPISGSPERGTPLNASSNAVDSDSDGGVRGTPGDTEKKESDVDEETIRSFLLRQSMELLTNKEFKFGEPKQHIKAKERERAKNNQVPKNFFEQLGDLFYNNNETPKSTKSRSRTGTNHVITPHNKNGTTVKAAW